MSTTTTISVENASTGLDVGGGHESSSAPDQDRLKSYSRIKLALAGQLRVLRDIVKKHGNERRERQCAELQVKLAEDRFTLAVVGQFKRGKSSLLNAIIGRELLPTGVLPLTSAITVLKFGPRERLVIEREGSPFLDTVPLDRLADYVTERGNPSNRLRVKTASVEVPLPFLRRGLEFVDTPGVGSTITANTATTDAFLPACDAVLLVTSVESPFTSVETEFLQAIRESVHKIFFVVNKTDLLAGHECREVLEFVTQTIREQTDTPDVRLFPVSCRLGLAAKREHDDLAYARSGLKILEEALAQFLSDEKTATFLAAVVDQALRILEAQAAEMHTRGSSAVQGQPANDVLPMPDLDDVRQRIISLRDEIRGLPIAAPIAEAVPQPMVESLPTPLEVVPAETDLTRDLRTRGCPVCDHLRQVAYDFFRHEQYALSSDNQAQEQFAAELGFCAMHFWQMEAMSSPVGASIGYARLTELIARRLSESARSLVSAEPIGTLLRDSRHCRVCRMLRDAEQHYVQRLAEFLREPNGSEAYTRSQGACLRHLTMLRAAVDDETARFLLTAAAHHFEEVTEDMQAFAMKTDALCRSLHNEDERDAYWRAITHLVGDKSLCIPWQEEIDIGG